MQKTTFLKKVLCHFKWKRLLNLMVYLKFSFEYAFSCYQLSKKLLNICLVLENFPFQETNGIVAMLLLT